MTKKVIRNFFVHELIETNFYLWWASKTLCTPLLGRTLRAGLETLTGRIWPAGRTLGTPGLGYSKRNFITGFLIVSCKLKL